MQSKRSREAYILIDHRNSPGITPEFLRANKIDAPAVGAGVTFESAISVCHCCQRDIILNPDRTRERAWCMSHDAYLCDECDGARASGADCVPFEKKLNTLWDTICKRSS